MSNDYFKKETVKVNKKDFDLMNELIEGFAKVVEEQRETIADKDSIISRQKVKIEELEEDLTSNDQVDVAEKLKKFKEKLDISKLNFGLKV